MCDLSAGVTLRFMEGDATTLITETSGTLPAKEIVSSAQAMTQYAYSKGLLSECDTETLLKKTYRESIGRQIREASNAQGLTIRQLADKCGLSNSHIARIESGRYAVTIDSIGVIASALGLDLVLI